MAVGQDVRGPALIFHVPVSLLLTVALMGLIVDNGDARSRHTLRVAKQENGSCGKSCVADSDSVASAGLGIPPDPGVRPIWSCG